MTEKEDTWPAEERQCLARRAGPQRGASVNVDSRAMGRFVLVGGMSRIDTEAIGRRQGRL